MLIRVRRRVVMDTLVSSGVAMDTPGRVRVKSVLLSHVDHNTGAVLNSETLDQ